MYRVAEGERRVLDRPEATDADTNVIKQDPSASAPAFHPEPQRPRTTSTRSSSIPPTENDPRDVVLHSDGCAIALHLSVVQIRCPWLYLQLEQLRHLSVIKNGAISLKVMENEEVRALQDKREDASKCPLRDHQALRLDYVRCAIHKCRRGQISSSQDSPVIAQRRKRLRRDPAAVTGENQPPSGQCVVRKSRRARRLFCEEDLLNPVDLFSSGPLEQQREVMHVKIEGTNIGAVVTSIEYIYRFKVRMIEESSAMEAVKLGQWLGMRHKMLYYCLVIAIRHVTTATWMEMLLAVSTLPDEVMRQIFRLKHHDMLLRVVMGLINSVILVEFWRNVLDALKWEPYMEIEPVKLQVKPGEGNLFTLVQFGKFQLQVRVDITDEMPILWRIIRTSSPNLLTTDPDYYAAFDDDPQFWIRSQMKVKYWRAQPNHAEVSHEIVLQYQHCHKKYSRWFFIWGDPVCSMYHVLLHNTLFYSAPQCSSTEVTDLLVVSEMERLPVETLVLVMRSDRLRIPEGERTLLRCLNKLVFGKNFSYHGSSTDQESFPHKYTGSAKDVVCLYKCVRWCFVPIDDIIGTLRHSPRELKFYELIEEGLQDTYRRFLRRRPWGWRKYRHAYMKNETNVVEFTIEAGDNKLSPEYFSCIQDGKIRTSSGVTTGMDMAHAFMASTYGQDVAETMSRYMENVPNTYPSDDPFATM
ncbi:hypothetical protein JG688_00013988 [Phytophthora aleatoria]|uniref:Uncharacterized protein n=1 Tax=Phytophthora aleatoria TaxID=2496075 RepID=A0A8J5IW87_9STRA|nr:hypothetical protein JG688_00013988 [Phytophthora aleatoria]